MKSIFKKNANYVAVKKFGNFEIGDKVELRLSLMRHYFMKGCIGVEGDEWTKYAIKQAKAGKKALKTMTPKSHKPVASKLKETAKKVTEKLTLKAEEKKNG